MRELATRKIRCCPVRGHRYDGPLRSGSSRCVRGTRASRRQVREVLAVHRDDLPRLRRPVNVPRSPFFSGTRACTVSRTAATEVPKRFESFELLPPLCHSSEYYRR